jgi:hypothetical protein
MGWWLLEKFQCQYWVLGRKFSKSYVVYLHEFFGIFLQGGVALFISLVFVIGGFWWIFQVVGVGAWKISMVDICLLIFFVAVGYYFVKYGFARGDRLWNYFLVFCCGGRYGVTFYFLLW